MGHKDSEAVTSTKDHNITTMDKQAIFSKVKALVEKYSENMDVRSDSDKNYSLYGKKTVNAYNKEVPKRKVMLSHKS